MSDIQEGHRRGEEEKRMGSKKILATTEGRGANNVYKCAKSDGT